MKVKLKIFISGGRNGVPWPPVGSEMELPDDEAAEMCERGWAEPVADTKKGEEHATAPKAEERTGATVKGSPGRGRD